MVASLVLVVASDAALRRSIMFLLESERFDTIGHPQATAAFASPHADRAACAVIDEDSIEDWRIAPAEFVRFAKPIILLVGLACRVSDVPLLRHVTKPFLGEPLVKLVRSAIAGAF